MTTINELRNIFVEAINEWQKSPLSMGEAFDKHLLAPIKDFKFGDHAVDPEEKAPPQEKVKKRKRYVVTLLYEDEESTWLQTSDIWAFSKKAAEKKAIHRADRDEKLREKDVINSTVLRIK